MKQVPPWKIGLPFAAGALIAGAAWFFSRQPTALFAVSVLVVWGAFWVYGARRSLRDSAREAEAPPFTPPAPGRAVVISRARHGLFTKRGYLMVTDEGFLWWRGTAHRQLDPGDTIAVEDLSRRGAPPRILATFAQIDGLRHEPGFIGGDRLILRTSGGRSICLSLYDPQGFILILELLGKNISF